MVTTALPATEETGVMQERTFFPSTRTAQAPHCASPHPKCGPLNFRSLRSTYRSGVSGADETTCWAPFAVRVSSFAMGFLPYVLRAVATRNHAGQLSAQLGIHAPPLLHVGIVNAVTAIARAMAELRLILATCKPLRAPQSATGKKRRRQSRERDSTRNRSRQNRQGANDRAALTQTVRRETDPTTKPPVQDHAARSKTLHKKSANPGPTVTPVAWRMGPLTSC